MQDVHAIGGGGGGCGGAGAAASASASSGLIFGDRRLRHHHQHQALKCPRCESVNTKFCYYNNYNLSQPRHFCKGCRRYWTKGGVLRNVPVGGGCRKSNKRSAKPKASTTSTSPVTSAASVPPAADISNSGSSSESTSNTTSTTTTTTTSVPALSTPAANTAADVSHRTSISDLNSIPVVLMNESSATLSISTTTNCSPTAAGINPRFPSELTRFSAIPSGLNINFEPLIDHNPFTELGSLMELMAAGVRDEQNNNNINNSSSCNNNDHNNNSTNMVSFDGCVDTTTTFRIGGGTDDDWFVHRLTSSAPEWQLDKIGGCGGGAGIEDVKVQDLSGGVLDQRVQFDLLQTRGVGGASSGCGVVAGGLDWQSGAPMDGCGCGGQHQSQHQGWFDLPSTVDQANFWPQTAQWCDNDHHLFPPP